MPVAAASFATSSRQDAGGSGSGGAGAAAGGAAGALQAASTTAAPNTGTSRVRRAMAATLPRRQLRGSTASTAAVTSAAIGSVRGRNRAATWPSGAMRNFSKFHCTSPAAPSASGTAVSSV